MIMTLKDATGSTAKSRSQTRELAQLFGVSTLQLVTRKRGNQPRNATVPSLQQICVIKTTKALFEVHENISHRSHNQNISDHQHHRSLKTLAKEERGKRVDMAQSTVTRQPKHSPRNGCFWLHFIWFIQFN